MAEAPATEAASAPAAEITVGGLIARSIGSSVAQMKEHEAGLRAGVDPDHVRELEVGQSAHDGIIHPDQREPGSRLRHVLHHDRRGIHDFAELGTAA